MDIAQLAADKTTQDLLVEFRQTGRQEPFEELVGRYSRMIFHVCYQVTKNAHDAEDATQAVFLTLAAQCNAQREIRCIGPWLQQVAYRLSLDMRKSKKRRQTRDEQFGLTNGERMMPDCSLALDSAELRHLLTEELNHLPAKYRVPLILRYFGGLSREEMARELNCKPTTLGVRLFRGREMLRNRLTECGYERRSRSAAAGRTRVPRPVHTCPTRRRASATFSTVRQPALAAHPMVAA